MTMLLCFARDEDVSLLGNNYSWLVMVIVGQFLFLIRGYLLVSLTLHLPIEATKTIHAFKKQLKFHLLHNSEH